MKNDLYAAIESYFDISGRIRINRQFYEVTSYTGPTHTSKGCLELRVLTLISPAFSSFSDVPDKEQD
ncbi:MAG: hypothetical protein ACJA19_001013 [Bacteroidia bacterium]